MGQDIWQLVDSGGIGGIERHMSVLTRALNGAGWPARILLYAPHADNPWLGQLEEEGTPFEVLDGRFSTLLARLKRERPRLLHTHGYKAGILGRLAARFAGVPVISTFHAGERGAFPVNVYQRLDEWTAFLGARVAVSDAIARALPAPAPVIGNFVEVPHKAPAPPASRAVGFVGRLSPEKGPDLFCALAERFAGAIPFEVFGDGPMRAELETRHGAQVRFHGLVRNPATIWPRIGLLLMPSRAEGLPMAAIEAMGAGVPVAASAVGALPGLIRNGVNGWLFPGGDLEAAHRAVAAWAAGDARERAAWSHAAWRTAHEGFSVEARLPAIITLYEDILRGAPRKEG